MNEARLTVNRAIDRTLADIRDPRRLRTPGDLLTLFRLPSPAALEITRAAEVYERTLEIIHQHVRQGKMTFNFSSGYHESSSNNLRQFSLQITCFPRTKHEQRRVEAFHTNPDPCLGPFLLDLQSLYDVGRGMVGRSSRRDGNGL